MTYLLEYDGLIGTFFEPWFEPCRGHLISSVTAGASKTLTLSAGETDGFEIGYEYNLFGENYRENTVVTDIIPSASQLVVDSLTYAYGEGSVISFHPNRFGLYCSENAYIVSFVKITEGNTGEWRSQGSLSITNINLSDPDDISGYYRISPIVFDAYNAGLRGLSVNDCVFGGMNILSTTEMHTVSISDLDTGTVSSATSGGTLTDSSKSWSVNEYAEKALIITGGTGLGQIRSIITNTSNVLTLNKSFILINFFKIKLKIINY
jgi:hypothetical protein